MRLSESIACSYKEFCPKSKIRDKPKIRDRHIFYLRLANAGQVA
jgi:hypothetical protein